MWIISKTDLWLLDKFKMNMGIYKHDFRYIEKW